MKDVTHKLYYGPDFRYIVLVGSSEDATARNKPSTRAFDLQVRALTTNRIRLLAFFILIYLLSTTTRLLFSVYGLEYDAEKICVTIPPAVLQKRAMLALVNYAAMVGVVVSSAPWICRQFHTPWRFFVHHFKEYCKRNIGMVVSSTLLPFGAAIVGYWALVYGPPLGIFALVFGDIFFLFIPTRPVSIVIAGTVVLDQASNILVYILFTRNDCNLERPPEMWVVVGQFIVLAMFVAFVFSLISPLLRVARRPPGLGLLVLTRSDCFADFTRSQFALERFGDRMSYDSELPKMHTYDTVMVAYTDTYVHIVSSTTPRAANLRSPKETTYVLHLDRARRVTKIPSTFGLLATFALLAHSVSVALFSEVDFENACFTSRINDLDRFGHTHVMNLLFYLGLFFLALATSGAIAWWVLAARDNKLALIPYGWMIVRTNSSFAFLSLLVIPLQAIVSKTFSYPGLLIALAIPAIDVFLQHNPSPIFAAASVSLSINALANYASYSLIESNQCSAERESTLWLQLMRSALISAQAAWIFRALRLLLRKAHKSSRPFIGFNQAQSASVNHLTDFISAANDHAIKGQFIDEEGVELQFMGDDAT